LQKINKHPKNKPTNKKAAQQSVHWTGAGRRHLGNQTIQLRQPAEG